MKRCLGALLLLLALCGPASTLADPAPQLIARAHLEPAGPVVAGSEVKLVVDLLTTTWFTEAPDWPLFTIPGAIVSLPDEQAVNLSETINGTHWFGVSRAYRIAPQAGRMYEIPAITITVHPGGMSGPATVTTPALKLVTTVPPGAQGMATFFPAPKLTVTQTIEPAAGHLTVGVPLTRTITQRAAGTESMFIPPVTLADVPGLKRYAKPATTKNIVEDRAGLVAGERTDSVTYLADRSGRYTLPPVTVEWWNTTTQRKETIVLPAVHLSVAAAHEKPLFDIPVDAMRAGMPHRIVIIHARQVILGSVIVLGLILLIALRARIEALLRRASRGLSDARKRLLASDALAWFRLARVARKGEWPRTIAALYAWMDRHRAFGRPARFENIPTAGDQDAEALIAAIDSQYAGGVSQRVSWKLIGAVLRRNGNRVKQPREKNALPESLNEY
jgi:hypothetical protein